MSDQIDWAACRYYASWHAFISIEHLTWPIHASIAGIFLLFASIFTYSGQSQKFLNIYRMCGAKILQSRSRRISLWSVQSTGTGLRLPTFSNRSARPAGRSGWRRPHCTARHASVPPTLPTRYPKTCTMTCVTPGANAAKHFFTVTTGTPDLPVQIVAWFLGKFVPNLVHTLDLNCI